MKNLNLKYFDFLLIVVLCLGYNYIQQHFHICYRLLILLILLKIRFDLGVYLHSLLDLNDHLYLNYYIYYYLVFYNLMINFQRFHQCHFLILVEMDFLNYYKDLDILLLILF